MTGRVMQIAAVATTTREVLFALTTDGEVWARAGFDGTWRRLPDIDPRKPEPTPTTTGSPPTAYQAAGHDHDG